ncbi:uncharacterized protein FYW61_002253 [Anableps anableps]
MRSIHVSLHADLHGLSQQQMAATEPEVEIPNSECSVHGGGAGPSALRHGEVKIFKILQATSSEQPVGLCSSVHRCFRSFSGIHAARSSFSGLVGCLSCVWTFVMRAWTVHCHPDSHGSRLCQNYRRAVLPVRRPYGRLCIQHRLFHGESRTVVNQQAGDKQKQRVIKQTQLSPHRHRIQRILKNS